MNRIDATSGALRDCLDSVKIYSDEAASARDAFGRLLGGSALKPIHSELYQFAIDQGLATALAFLEQRKRSAAVRQMCTVLVTRPRWWPGNLTNRSLRDVLLLQLGPKTGTGFVRSWGALQAKLATNVDFSICSLDPSLVFRAYFGKYLCRTACVGHEGCVYYFVYGDRERTWKERLSTAGLKFWGSGESAYRALVDVPGQIAGR